MKSPQLCRGAQVSINGEDAEKRDYRYVGGAVAPNGRKDVPDCKASETTPQKKLESPALA